jgi:hypothetical protein
LDYTETAYFRLITTPRGRNTYERVFSGSILGEVGQPLGDFILADGRVRAAIMCRNTDAAIKIESDSVLPCAFTSAEWEAEYTNRARKV